MKYRGCIWARFLSSLCEGNKSKANALSERQNLFTKFAVLEVHCPSSSSKTHILSEEACKVQIPPPARQSQLFKASGRSKNSVPAPPRERELQNKHTNKTFQRQLENRDFSVRGQHSKNTLQLQLEHRKFSVQMQCAKIRKGHLPSSSWNSATLSTSAVCEVHFHLFVGFSAA